MVEGSSHTGAWHGDKRRRRTTTAPGTWIILFIHPLSHPPLFRPFELSGLCNYVSWLTLLQEDMVLLLLSTSRHWQQLLLRFLTQKPPPFLYCLCLITVIQKEHLHRQCSRWSDDDVPYGMRTHTPSGVIDLLPVVQIRPEITASDEEATVTFSTSLLHYIDRRIRSRDTSRPPQERTVRYRAATTTAIAL